MNKYEATHNGFTFRRFSKTRTYSHAVIERRSVADDRRGAESYARECWERNYKWHMQVVAGTNPQFSRNPKLWTPELVAEEQERSRAWLTGGEEGHVTRMMAKHDVRVAGQKTDADGDTYWLCAGWCGRHDLAVALAGRCKREAIIIEARVIAGHSL